MHTTFAGRSPSRRSPAASVHEERPPELCRANPSSCGPTQNLPVGSVIPRRLLTDLWWKIQTSVRARAGLPCPYAVSRVRWWALSSYVCAGVRATAITWPAGMAPIGRWQRACVAARHPDICRRTPSLSDCSVRVSVADRDSPCVAVSAWHRTSLCLRAETERRDGLRRVCPLSTFVLHVRGWCLACRADWHVWHHVAGGMSAAMRRMFHTTDVPCIHT